MKGAIFTALAIAIALIQPSYASSLNVDFTSTVESTVSKTEKTEQHCHSDCIKFPSGEHSPYLSHEVPSQARLNSFRSIPVSHAVNAAEPTVSLSNTIFKLKRPPRA